MNVGSTFRVDADERQYRLERVRQTKSRKDPNEIVDAVDVTFHASLHQVARRIAEYEMRDSVQASEDVWAAARCFENAVQRIEASLTEQAIARCKAAHPAGAR